jgi:catechol 2,3-dioxygenase-like lactoylglutathione lyase family enzyme
VRSHACLQLAKFHNPAAVSAHPKNAPVNTLGIRRIMFAVEDIEDVLARLRAHGAELVGELENYEDSYRLCYVRGPEGINRRTRRAAQLNAAEGGRSPEATQAS